MAKNKMTVYDIKDEYDATHYAKKKGGTVKECSRHTKIIGPRGCVFLPRHRKEFATGTRWSIIKQLIAIGLGVFILSYIVIF